DHEIIPPQPSGFAHFCLGTGPKTNHGDKFFNLNVIELPDTNHARENGEPPVEPVTQSEDPRCGDAPRIHVLRPNSEPAVYCRDKLHPWMRPHSPSPSPPDTTPSLRERMLEKIDWEVDQLIWVCGLPGNARFTPFEREDLIPFKDRQLPCFTKELKGTRADAIKSLKELKRHMREEAPRDQKVVVVIRDLLLDTWHSKSGYLEEISSALKFLTRYNHSLFYISNALGPKVDYKLSLDLSYGSQAPLICDPFDYPTMERLDAHFCKRIPLDRGRVGYFTGRYAGLSLRMFESAKRDFDGDGWWGARRIRRDTR